MPENFSRSFEQEQNPLERLSQGDKDRVEQAVGEYLAEHPDFTEFIDKDIDEILNRLLEKGPELSPDVKRSLRRAVHFLLLGIKKESGS